MYIAIDGNEANIERRVGVHQYAFELLKGFNKINFLKPDRDKDNFIIYLKDKRMKDLPEENKHLKYKILPGNKMWILTKLMPDLLIKEKYDVFFSPNHYLPIISQKPQVCTIHDLGYLRFSGQFKKYDYWQLKYWTAISLYISKCIIAVSQSTKEDIVRRYPSTSDKIRVIHHGCNHSIFNENISGNVVRQIKNKYHINGNYILFLSTLKPSKNIEGLLKAFKLVLNDVSNYKLVIAGKKGWMYDSIFKETHHLGLEKKVIFTDYVEEEDKPGLIKGSKVFVLPSFWEGFGMDIVNALSCGIPTIVSDVGGMSELIKDSNLRVDPTNIKDIAEKIFRVIKLNPKEYNQLSRKCIIEGKQYNWDKTASQTLDVIRKSAKLC